MKVYFQLLRGADFLDFLGCWGFLDDGDELTNICWRHVEASTVRTLCDELRSLLEGRGSEHD